MIALTDGIPCLESDAGELMVLDRVWLVRSVEAAARRAGYPNWWLAEHVAASVLAYFHDGVEANALPAAQFTALVKSALQVIGYAEVAEHFQWQAPPRRISLPELAQRAGTGYELVFFEMLGREVRELLDPATVHFEIIGLKSCVRQLSASKHWSRHCEQLQSEIVSYVRRQILQGARTGDITFSLS